MKVSKRFFYTEDKALASNIRICQIFKIWHISLHYIILLLLFFLATIYPLSAQYTLTGKIIDGENGEGLIGAAILLTTDFSGTQTDVDGHFSLATPDREGTLIISYIGYEEASISFQDTDVPLAISLTPKATTMETVIVKGEQLSGQIFAAEKINKLDIYLNPSAQGDPLKAVQSSPATTTIDETANVSLRGSPASETGVFLNNVPINDVVRLDQSNGVGQFSVFNTNTIKSLSVFPSNPPLEFGNATSGVVALYTDDEFPERINSLSLNLTGIGIAMVRKMNAKTSISLLSNWSTEQLLTSINKTSLQDLNHFNTLDIGLQVVHQFNQHWQLKFFNYAIAENYRYQVRFPQFEDEFQQNKKRNQAILNLIQQKETTRFEWNQGFNISKANYHVGNLDIHTDNIDYFSGLNYAWYPKNGSIKIGLHTNMHQISSSGETPLFEHGLSKEFPSIPFESSEWLIIPEGFIYSKWTFQENFSVGVGGRYHPTFDDLESYGSYQLNLAYTLANKHRLIASTGAYHKYQVPNGETTYTQKIFSRQYSIDYQGSKGRLDWSAAIYQKNNTREDVPNIVKGIEGFATYQGTQLKVGVSLAHIQSTLEEEGQSYPSTYDLSYFLRTTLQYQWQNTWSVGVIYWQRQGRYYLPVSHSLVDEQTQNYFPVYVVQQEGKRLPDYHRLDISLSKILETSFGTAILYANINNLLDFKNISRYNYNFDYSDRFSEYLNRRVLFFGVVFNWE